MYGIFFGLRSLPFEDRADTQFFYPTAACKDALAAMEYEIRHGTGLGLLIGEAGTGKSVLLRTLLRRLEKSDQPVVVTWPANGAADLIRECSKGFGVTLPFSGNRSNGLNKLRRHLGRWTGRQGRSILIVDQAENLSLSNIAQLATLAELCGERGKLLSIILAAQPLVRALLDRPEFAWIRQQLLGERTLPPLGPKETGKYIRHRLQIAGARDTRLFDDYAISLIHEVSEGNPRLINRACHAAMMAAYASQKTCITRTIVEAACDQGGSSLTSQPIVRERTIAARELGPIGIGPGSPPWLSDPVSRDGLANSEESPTLPSSIASCITPADIFNNEEADDAESGTKDTSGASIVDGECNGSKGEFLGPGPSRGAFLLARMERTMARAERITSTTDLALSRLAAVEQRLASLVDQARRQTEELGVASEDAATQLAKLTAETRRATQTLQEWAEEAIRTQSRLEQTLNECPPIRQTHPMEAVRRLSRVVEPFARITADAAGGQLQVLSEPDLDAAPIGPRMAKPPAGAEEIAQLISEAMAQETPAPV